VLVGDVSGKGIPASLFMVRASSLARLLARDGAEPERILARLNDELSADNPSGMFVTMLCALYDPVTRTVGDGQRRPLPAGAVARRRGRRGRCSRWARHWASRRNWNSHAPTCNCRRATRWCCTPTASTRLSTIRLPAMAMRACWPTSPTSADSRQRQSAPAVATGARLRGRRGAIDDIAILVLRPAPAARSLRLRLRATPEEVMRSVEQLQAFGREHRVDEKIMQGLAVALEECASNIVRYAGLDRSGQEFDVSLERTDEGLAIELRDPGPAFDPTAAATVQAAPGEALRGEGGWGIELVRYYTDEISYRRSGGDNVLRLSKRLQL
jgi:anti-sigma regulatory factor (Ser/Thr protein kinase)